MTQAPQHATQGGARRDAATDGSRTLDRDASTGLENQNVTRPMPPDTSSAEDGRVQPPGSGGPGKGQASSQ